MMRPINEQTKDEQGSRSKTDSGHFLAVNTAEACQRGHLSK
jgi:hypothetical protein